MMKRVLVVLWLLAVVLIGSLIVHADPHGVPDPDNYVKVVKTTNID